MAGKNTRPRVLEFSGDLGDLSPIPEFKGPKTPSNRQVLRLFLFYFMSLGYQKLDAAKSVVTEVLKKHTTTAVSKTPGRLISIRGSVRRSVCYAFSETAKNEI